MTTIKKYISPIIGISILIFLIVSSVIKTSERNENIELNKFQTVAKVIKFHSNRSSSRYYYIYYYKNNKYYESQDIDYQNRDECVGKYYKVILSTENPKYSNLDLNEEITDSLKLISAGFKI